MQKAVVCTNQAEQNLQNELPSVFSGLTREASMKGCCTEPSTQLQDGLRTRNASYCLSQKKEPDSIRVYFLYPYLSIVVKNQVPDIGAFIDLGRHQKLLASSFPFSPAAEGRVTEKHCS